MWRDFCGKKYEFCRITYLLSNNKIKQTNKQKMLTLQKCRKHYMTPGIFEALFHVQINPCLKPGNLMSATHLQDPQMINNTTNLYLVHLKSLLGTLYFILALLHISEENIHAIILHSLDSSFLFGLGREPFTIGHIYLR